MVKHFSEGFLFMLPEKRLFVAFKEAGAWSVSSYPVKKLTVRDSGFKAILHDSTIIDVWAYSKVSEYAKQFVKMLPVYSNYEILSEEKIRGVV